MKDAKRLDLPNVKAVSSSEYIFDTATEKEIEKTLRELSVQEYFSPKNNAWWVFRHHYLLSAPGILLGNELFPDFTARDISFGLRDNPLTSMWSEFESYRKSSCGLFFNGVSFSQIEHIDTVCRHFYVNLRSIIAQSKNDQFRFGVMKGFLDHPADDSLMYAVFVWFHAAYPQQMLDTRYHNLFCERLADWIARYKQEFLMARELIKPKEDYYQMFNETFQQVCFTMWDQTFDYIRNKETGLLKRGYSGIVADIQPYLRETLETYINLQPQNKIIYHTYEMLWNLLWEMFCLKSEEQELIYVMHLLFPTPNRWSSFKKMCVDFIHEKDRLTEGILLRYHNSLSNTYDLETTDAMCNDLAYSLISNGFPPNW